MRNCIVTIVMVTAALLMTGTALEGRAVRKQLLAAAEHDRNREDGHAVDEVVGQERTDEFGATLGDKIGAVFVPQALYVGDVAQEHRALPARIDPARARMIPF